MGAETCGVRQLRYLMARRASPCKAHNEQRSSTCNGVQGSLRRIEESLRHRMGQVLCPRDWRSQWHLRSPV